LEVGTEFDFFSRGLTGGAVGNCLPVLPSGNRREKEKRIGESQPFREHDPIRIKSAPGGNRTRGLTEFESYVIPDTESTYSHTSR
jgi:hypothetical protein